MTLRTAFTDLRHDLLPRRGPSRLVAFVGAGWMFSTVFHLGVFLADDRPWAGAISWRKPVLFGFSFAVILWSFGWMLDRLPHRPRLSWFLSVFMAVTSTVEVALITMQTWRGRASHFNTADPGDALIFSVMGMMAGLIAVALIWVFVWALIRRPASPLDRLALIAGMVFVISGLGVGQWLVSVGLSYVEQFDRVPDQVIAGEAGDVKFPHAVAFHGLQIFMVCAAMLRRGAVPAATAQWLMRAVVTGYTALMMFSIVQTVDGRAPMDLAGISAGLFGMAAVLMLGSGSLIIRHWLRPVATPVVARTSAKPMVGV